MNEAQVQAQADGPPLKGSAKGMIQKIMTPVGDNSEGSRPLPMCMPCNESEEQKLGAAQPKSDGVQSKCPNRIIDLQELKNMINPNLLPCTKCKKGQLQLVEKSHVSYSSVFELRCDNCYNEKLNLQKKINYEEKKVAGLKINTKSDQDKKNKLKQKIYSKKRTLTKLEHHLRFHETVPKSNKEGDCTELNTRALLSSFFIGSGGQDIGSVANFFGFPGGKSWERFFSRKSKKVQELIINIVDEILNDSLANEIIAKIRVLLKGKATEEEIDENINFFKSGEYDKMHQDLRSIGIAITYDMGWQKRATGRIYDSLSGHGFFIGALTRDIVQYGLKKKRCATCSCLNASAQPYADHNCTVNWEGSSGAMESALALTLVLAIHEKYNGLVYVEQIITDDNSTMQSHLKNVKNGGKLPDHIRQPSFGADPSHRIKVMCKPIFAMVSDTKDPDKCKTVDATRIKRYTSYYIRQNRTKPLSKFVKNARAPIEHLFNDHQWCNSSWCWAKELEEKKTRLMTHVFESNQNNKEQQLPMGNLCHRHRSMRNPCHHHRSMRNPRHHHQLMGNHCHRHRQMGNHCHRHRPMGNPCHRHRLKSCCWISVMMTIVMLPMLMMRRRANTVQAMTTMRKLTK